MRRIKLQKRCHVPDEEVELAKLLIHFRVFLCQLPTTKATIIRMYFTQTIVGLATAAMVALSPPALAFTTSCLYQEYACGYNLISLNGIVKLNLGKEPILTSSR